MSQDLYEQDFYLWTREQAAALRARSAGANALDYDLLAEEVEDLGSAQRNACMSAVRLILEHFYKLHATQRREPTGHWKGEVENFRADLENQLTPAIRIAVQGDLEKLHQRAARIARSRFQTHEPETVIDPDLRWTWDQITGDADDPLERDYPLSRD